MLKGLDNIKVTALSQEEMNDSKQTGLWACIGLSDYDLLRLWFLRSILSHPQQPIKSNKGDDGAVPQAGSVGL